LLLKEGVLGEGENFFSREKKFSPSPNPILFQEKRSTFLNIVLVLVFFFYTFFALRAFLLALRARFFMSRFALQSSVLVGNLC